MSAALPYQVAIAQDEIVVRFDRNLVQPSELSEFLDYLRLKVVRRQNQLTDEEIAELADEINRSGWARIREDFLAGLQ
jgi:hypothetical protein